MEKEIFNKLFGGGELEVLYSNLETLTPEQRRSVEIGLGIRNGQKESPVMNNYTESLEQKFEPNRIGRAMNGETKLKGQTDDKMQEEPEEEQKSKKDPNISRVAPNTHTKLKKCDSEADILAKMFNMMSDDYNSKRKRQEEYDNLIKIENKDKDKQTKNLLKTFGRKKPKKQKQKEKELDINWAKFAAVAGVLGFGLFGMEKSFASFKTDIKNYKLPNVDDIMKEASKNPDNELYPNVDYVKAGHGNLLSSIKSPESIAGGGSTEELYEALDYIQQLQPDLNITAMNDLEHHLPKYNKNGRVDPHVKGIAADIKLPVMSDKIAKELQEDLNKQGIKATVMYEPPTGKNTVNPEGHMHLQVAKYDSDPKKLENKPLETSESTPTTPSKSPQLQLAPKEYPLEKTDMQVKDMQTVKGQSKNPKINLINQTVVNQGAQINVKRIIKKIEDQNMEDNIALVKQFGTGNK